MRTQLNLLATQRGETIYRHDLMLLGMGDDGHTASLFPGTLALEEQTRRVVANFVPKFNTWRLTMTLPLLDQSRHVLFLASGDEESRLLERSHGGDAAYPAARVEPVSGQLTWIIGESRLTSAKRAHRSRHRLGRVDRLGDGQAFCARRLRVVGIDNDMRQAIFRRGSFDPERRATNCWRASPTTSITRSTSATPPR